MSRSLAVPGRFNEPLRSGHGGYCSGVIADFVEGPAEITLRSPVLLDIPLDVMRESDGSVRGLDGETLVAEAQSAPNWTANAAGDVLPESIWAVLGYPTSPE